MSRLHYFLIAINFASPSLSHCSLISSLSSPPLSHLLAITRRQAYVARVTRQLEKLQSLQPLTPADDAVTDSVSTASTASTASASALPSSAPRASLCTTVTSLVELRAADALLRLLRDQLMLSAKILERVESGNYAATHTLACRRSDSPSPTWITDRLPT